MALYTPRRRRKPEINIVPLVDVLIVLIFFFLMTMSFKDQQVLDITPPKIDTATGQVVVANRLLVGIDKAGKYFVNSVEVSEDQLDAQLKKTATEHPDSVIIVLADQDTPLKRVTFVMDESRKLNLDKVRLLAR